eukprot:SAG22_NODE_1689_length_3806_cov_7.093067_5_plen_204_part_00
MKKMPRRESGRPGQQEIKRKPIARMPRRESGRTSAAVALPPPSRQPPVVRIGGRTLRRTAYADIVAADESYGGGGGWICDVCEGQMADPASGGPSVIWHAEAGVGGWLAGSTGGFDACDACVGKKLREQELMKLSKEELVAQLMGNGAPIPPPPLSTAGAATAASVRRRMPRRMPRRESGRPGQQEIKRKPIARMPRRESGRS